METDPFDDIQSLYIDPADPALKPRQAAVGPRSKRQWEREFIRFPWTWFERLETKSGATYRLALFLVYEHWRHHGRTIRLTNVMAAEAKIGSKAKWRALVDLERLGLVRIERRTRQSPLVTVLLKLGAERKPHGTETTK